MEADMNRMVLKPVLAFGAALILLGGCASYDGYDRGYGSGAYYGGGYYSGYYEPDYYGRYGYYGRTYIPRGSYGGGYGGSYRRDGGHRDGDHVRNRDSDRDQNRSQDRGDRRDYNRGDRSDNGGQRSGDVSRSQPASPPPQQSFSGRDGGGRQDSGSHSRGGPEGRFGHPGTTANPL
jgi:hypothetical protein